MRGLIKPKRLLKGDKVATVSLSWGGAGDEDLLWKYNKGKQRLEEQFGLEVVEMENTLKGSEYVYMNPKKRAEDLMNAFKDESIKGIFSCIGGEESVRMLPYIDFDVIRENPKVFIGYSDTTIAHMICLKAGVSSFYGPSVLGEFGENGKIFDYTVEYINKVLFDGEVIGDIPIAEGWTGERIEWVEENKHLLKELKPNGEYEILQGSGVVQGRLIGGCIEVLEMIKGTVLWPDIEEFDDTILFFETSEDTPEPEYIEYWLRNYGSQRILHRVNGIIFGKPYQGKYYEEYKEKIIKVLKELDLTDMPVMYNMSFGHNQPMCILPYGANSEIDCDNKKFAILESGTM